jgi:hypothetical protein
MKTWQVRGLFSATAIEDVEAETAEEAAENCAFSVSLCCQCTNEIEFDDSAPYAIDVLDEEGEIVFRDGNHPDDAHNDRATLRLLANYLKDRGRLPPQARAAVERWKSSD